MSLIFHIFFNAVKYLDNIPEEAIAELNIPTGVPLVYSLDENMKPIPHPNAIAPLQVLPRPLIPPRFECNLFSLTLVVELSPPYSTINSFFTRHDFYSKGRYIGNQEDIRARILGVKNQTK